MSSFWNFVTTMVSGTLARAEDVNTNLSGINTGFNLVETEINKAIQVTNSPGTTDISENAAARASKLIGFDASGDVVLSTTIGSYRGNHADAAGTDYYVRDVVKDAAASLGLNNLYICNTAHTSTGDLATDTANWDLLVDVADVEADKVAAEAAAAAAAISADFLDDRILGAFTTAAEPTLDNDGNALLTGALYFNTTLNRMKVYNGSSWQLTTASAVDVAVADAGGYYTGTDVEAALQEAGPARQGRIDIYDDNGVLLLVRGAIASALNWLKIDNGASGNKPSIYQVGTDDVGIDIEGVELHNESISATTTNGDLELTRNGTGDITVDSVPIYGLVILDEPVNILSMSGLAGSWTTLATGAPAGAKKAILRCTAYVYDIVGVANGINKYRCYIKSVASISSSDHTTLVCDATVYVDNGSSTNDLQNYANNEITVNLDSSRNVQYTISQTLVSGVTGVFDVALVGYYM